MLPIIELTKYERSTYSRAEQSRAEQSRAEQSRAEQSIRLCSEFILCQNLGFTMLKKHHVI